MTTPQLFKEYSQKELMKKCKITYRKDLPNCFKCGGEIMQKYESMVETTDHELIHLGLSVIFCSKCGRVI